MYTIVILRSIKIVYACSNGFCFVGFSVIVNAQKVKRFYLLDLWFLMKKSFNLSLNVFSFT